MFRNEQLNSFLSFTVNTTFNFLSRGSWKDMAGVGWKTMELVCAYSVEPAETRGWNTVMLWAGSLSLEITFLQSSWQGNQSPCMAWMLCRPPTRTDTGNRTHATACPLSCPYFWGWPAVCPPTPDPLQPGWTNEILCYLVGGTTVSPTRPDSLPSLSFLGYSPSALEYHTEFPPILQFLSS